MTLSSDELCTICRHPKNDHPFRHMFTTAATGNALIARDDERTDHASSAPGENQGHVRMTMKGDPVLRLIMMRKGLITVQDLDDVEAELRASGAAGYEPDKTLG